ncbi:hypothetical protein MWN34_08185 [Ancylobacter sp. 6x-1]|uniref:Uncharacterized protein n=1 Tax=Ancylobacter crimeensis TaxID=2579147 RepID=A0ABT0DAA2_9HYPH|nr:hypothetical protein [Ancylobacter crimeensis]MCK0196891.1 hypothetical protein [Ancylobacter crimeensis]
MSILRIERTQPRPGVVEEPLLTPRGYKLGDPLYGRRKHHAEFAVYVKTLEEAAALIRRGHSLWMHARGKRGSLISPGSLRIVEA